MIAECVAVLLVTFMVLRKMVESGKTADEQRERAFKKYLEEKKGKENG